jgi:Type II secretion system (T2SS), protein M subtype b
MSLGTWSSARPRLRLEVALWRFGWGWSLVGLLATSTACIALWWLPRQQRGVADLRVVLQEAHTARSAREVIAPVAPPLSGDDAVMQQMRQNCYAQTELSSILLSISKIAKAQGIELAQSSFQTSTESHGGLRQVKLVLPVVATYPKLRRFVEDILRQLAGVSVDQLGLKRDAVARGEADVQLALSIWIDPHKTIAASAVGGTPAIAAAGPAHGGDSSAYLRREETP